MKKNKIPDIIRESKKEDLLHVFLTVSPLTSVIFRMIVEKYKINKSKIKVFSFRNTDTSIIDFSVKKITRKRYHRFFEKFFWDSPVGRQMTNIIGNNHYILYSSWSYREANWLVNNKNCKGHIYIEEGQHSYMKISSYDPKKISLINRIKNNWKSRFSSNDEFGFYFRNDAAAFIGISEDIFPNMPENKKYYLDNLNDMKKYYNPKLLGITKIGLSCASRRIQDNKWDVMLNKIFDHLGGEGAVKAHPSFSVSKEIKNKFKRQFESLNKNNYLLCSDEIIIELEMLFESKKIFGPQTSLSRYTELLGSEFINIKLY